DLFHHSTLPPNIPANAEFMRGILLRPSAPVNRTPWKSGIHRGAQGRFPAARDGSAISPRSDADILHADIDAADGNASEVFHLVLHGLDDGGRDGADRDAVFDNDEQVDVHLVAGRADLHAAAEVFTAHELHDAVRRALGRHADDAVAIQRGIARH